MASGDLILSSGTVITAAEIQQIAAEVKKELAAESKELAEFEEVSSLTGVSSLPSIQQSGTTMKLVRVALSVLKGVDGKSVELTASSTAVQWRYVGETEWNTLVELSLLKGDKGAQGIQGTPGLPPVIEMGTVTTLLPDSDVTATLTPNGETAAGNPKYLLNLGVPAGRPGQDGDGAGNVYINEAEKMESGKLYLFQPGADGMVNGYFVEYVGQQSVGQKNPDYPGAELFNDYENNIAAGQYAHAEGKETVATGPRAHTEGYRTSVYAADAHAEGRETWCLGAQGHVEGLYGISWGAGSHTEGAVQADFEVEGKAILNDEESIRDFLGYYTTRYYPNGEGNDPYYWKINDSFFTSYYTHGAFGVNTHAEGINNIVCDKAGHVEGYNNVAGVIVSGNYSFAHGYGLSVSNDYEVAFGRYNLSEIDGKKVIFSIGIGSSSTRKNALSIFEDGSADIPGLEVSISTEQLDKAIAEAVNPLSNRIDNMYNELDDRLTVVETAVDEITAMLSGIYTGTKVHVVGDRLIMTSLIDASVVDDTLVISDSETRVDSEILVFDNVEQ